MTVFQAHTEASAVEGVYNNVIPISPRPTRLDQRIARPVAERVVRRRASFEQGRSLETLGHAVEYLVDSGLFITGEQGNTAKDRQEAIQILMRMSRLVFSECREVVSLWARLGRAVDKMCAGNEECKRKTGESESEAIHLSPGTRQRVRDASLSRQAAGQEYAATDHLSQLR